MINIGMKCSEYFIRLSKKTSYFLFQYLSFISFISFISFYFCFIYKYWDTLFKPESLNPMIYHLPFVFGVETNETIVD